MPFLPLVLLYGDAILELNDHLETNKKNSCYANNGRVGRGIEFESILGDIIKLLDYPIPTYYTFGLIIINLTFKKKFYAVWDILSFLMNCNLKHSNFTQNQSKKHSLLCTLNPGI